MIYFDNNATTPVAPDVMEAMLPFLKGCFGNPSSAYRIGREARLAVEQSRESVASLLGAHDSRGIVFTSGGTESDNWAILGALDSRPEKKHIISTTVEHDAIHKMIRKLEANGYNVTWLEVDEEGGLETAKLSNALRPETALVSVMMANNETGILFPVDEFSKITKERSDALFHVDGVNAAGKIPIDLRSTEIDLFSISAHKFYGPKGIGALYIREGIDIKPYLIGGGQERGRRAGTEAIHQIAGMGAAAEFVSDLSAIEKVRQLRDRLENEILDKIPNSRLNGTSDPAKRLPNTASISFKDTNGEMILDRLDREGICVSTGSACNAADHTASPVLAAMNVPYSWAMGSIRFSLGRFTTAEEVSAVLEVLPKTISEIRTQSGAAV